MLDRETLGLVEKIFKICSKKQLKLRTVESCTGGLIATYLTHLPGSSKFFDRSIVTYSNGAKSDLCKIDPLLIAKYGAVSFETAIKMIESFTANKTITIATTGLLGPDGDGSSTKVGTIYIGVNFNNNHTYIKRLTLNGDREQLQHLAVKESFSLLQKLNSNL